MQNRRAYSLRKRPSKGVQHHDKCDSILANKEKVPICPCMVQHLEKQLDLAWDAKGAQTAPDELKRPLASLERNAVIAQGDCAFASVMFAVSADFRCRSYQQQVAACRQFRAEQLPQTFTEEKFNAIYKHQPRELGRARLESKCQYADLRQLFCTPMEWPDTAIFELLADMHRLNIALFSKFDNKGTTCFAFDCFFGSQSTREEVANRRWILLFHRRNHFEPMCIGDQLQFHTSNHPWLSLLTKSTVDALPSTSSVEVVRC